MVPMVAAAAAIGQFMRHDHDILLQHNIVHNCSYDYHR